MGFFSFLGFDKKNELQDFINKEAIIIDVRTSNEYASGHISGSKTYLLIPLRKK
nr:rhodanese-like domain-containing protein [Flavobacterium oreochromis]